MSLTGAQTFLSVARRVGKPVHHGLIGFGISCDREFTLFKLCTDGQVTPNFTRVQIKFHFVAIAVALLF